jgi:hypothetical protein
MILQKNLYYHQSLLAIEYTIFKSLGHAGIGSEEMIGQRQEQEIQGEAYSNFINSLNSEVTRRGYRANFAYFMKYCKITGT